MKSNWNMIAAVLLVMLAIIQFSTPVLAESGMPRDGMQQTTPTQMETRTYAVGWGALALINAGLAQGKNRGGLNWFLLSILLGPIATLLLVAFFPKQPPATP